MKIPGRIRSALNGTFDGIRYSGGRTPEKQVDFVYFNTTYCRWVHVNSFDEFKVDKQKLRAQEEFFEKANKAWAHLNARSGIVMKCFTPPPSKTRHPQPNTSHFHNHTLEP